MQILTSQHIGKVVGGGNSTKIHTVVDDLGTSLSFQLSKGNQHDNTVEVDILLSVTLINANVFADKIYGTVETREYIVSKGVSFYQSQIQKIYGLVTGGYIKNAI